MSVNDVCCSSPVLLVGGDALAVTEVEENMRKLQIRKCVFCQSENPFIFENCFETESISSHKHFFSINTHTSKEREKEERLV